MIHHPISLAGRGLFLVLCLALLSPAPIHAQAAEPFIMAKQFSAEQVITDRGGNTMTNKIFMDNGRVRSEITAHGMKMVSIVLPDTQKVYSIMPDQKMVMVMPYDPAKFKGMSTSTALAGTFTYIGPDIVDGVACSKYRNTTEDKKVFFLWTDATRKIPVKITAEDGSFTALWKNYKEGPQDAALFQVPAGYQMMDMPVMPNLPAH